ncbi:MAG: hypothetical protein IJ097_01865 [Bacilli bacterium]|nr:hypothetical protein [Bacilli bacterium]
MKNVKYYLFYFILLCLILLYFYSNSKIVINTINEEAIPIREYDEITAMNYNITLNDIRTNNIKISSSILSSIYHYKDISNINDFLVYLNIDNNTSFNYLINNISIVDKRNKKIIKKIKYNNNENNIYFNLNKTDFNKYDNNCDIVITLRKKYL